MQYGPGLNKRKPRAIICDGEALIRNMLEHFLQKKGYEVLAYPSPSFCPIYADYAEGCSQKKQCADILMTDLYMPHKSGIELLMEQAKRGCKMDIKNKAILADYLDADVKIRIQDIGCSFFRKPFQLSALSAWLQQSEKRFDLTVPLESPERRKETRHATYKEAEYSFDMLRKLHKGIVVNFSKSGLCFTAYQRLTISQTLKFHSELPNNFHAGVVQWVRPLRNNLFSAGLYCL
jgi:DNA-binding response OmpR family regulator